MDKVSSVKRSILRAPSYREHIETLTALIVHLAATEWPHRSPSNLAKATSIDVSEITLVLEGFKGLFRKSTKVTRANKNPLHTLQFRYARQWLINKDDGEEVREPPLNTDAVAALIQFVTDRANAEARRSEAYWTVLAAFVASFLALVASQRATQPPWLARAETAT